MADLMKKQKMWHSFLLKLRTFADLVYSHGPYTDWFYGESSKDESIAKKLEKCLREALKSLHKTAVQCYQVQYLCLPLSSPVLGVQAGLRTELLPRGSRASYQARPVRHRRR